PILAAVDQDDVLLGKFAGLQQRQHFPKFVHGPKAARKHDQGLGNLREPKFAHEKVLEIEAQFRADVWIRKLLVRKLDRKADRLPARFIRSALGCFHNSRPAAGTSFKAPRPEAEGARP